LGGIFDLPSLRDRYSELDKRSQDPGLWDDREQAQALLRERANLESQIAGYDQIAEALAELPLYLDMVESEEDEAMIEFESAVSALELRVEDLQVRRMLSGEYDLNNVIVTIRPGAGGTESQDWGDMLLRMYLRWAERRDLKSRIIEYQPGEGAGLKSATIAIDGEYAYGYMRAETGVHRLVRISPFDNASRRHTSFCSVLCVS